MITKLILTRYLLVNVSSLGYHLNRAWYLITALTKIFSMRDTLVISNTQKIELGQYKT